MITLHYASSWLPAYLYVQVDEVWQTIRMQAAKPFWHVLSLRADRLEFVFTDNEGNWDNPIVGGNYCIEAPGKYAVYKGSLLPLQDNPYPIMLVSDLDDTMIGSSPLAREACRRFSEYWITNHLLDGSKLVYNTGRSLQGFLQIFASGIDLLNPDMVITCVGSEAYVMNKRTRTYELCKDFYNQFPGDTWHTQLVSSLLKEHFPWLTVPCDDSSLFKVWRFARQSDLLEHGKKLKMFFKNPANWEHSGQLIKGKVIVSGHSDCRFVDICHINGGKMAGVIYAQRRYGIPSSRTVVAGDSGNDIDMMKGRELGVIVANCTQDLSTWFYKRHREGKYISCRQYADAIIEAVAKLSAY